MTRVRMILGFLGITLAMEVYSGLAPLEWPPMTRECRPGAYWWWLGSAVDRTNITRELQRYHHAGMGAVHIIPIYGAKGWEDRYIPYLSPQWLEMLNHTVAEAERLDMNVDMTTGTGWCFGGPGVTEQEANALAVVKTFKLAANTRFTEKLDRKVQAVVAFEASGKSQDLTSRLKIDGTLDWAGAPTPVEIYAISQRPSGQKVKRSAPGGGGHMLNLFYPAGVTNYLNTFTKAFAGYTGKMPRAMYHDSYEYRSDWGPDLLAHFEQRRGYRLQDHLPAFFGKGESDYAARLKCDYRETISEVMAEVSLPAWTDWCHQRGIITRNQAHGSPGNLLDLYAAADIPETEMFHTDRNRLVSKFASSAAHVTGKRLVASETGTWLQEHFTETLADMKYLLDDLFLSGVNHIYYHGTCYSPDEAPWPGWLFYASYEMNPRNSIWRDVPALNTYAARSEAVLQYGRPDNDILLYWPIHDRWHNAKGRVQPFTVHARDWLEGQSIGKAAELLWSQGYGFDYISDHQLLTAEASGGSIKVPGGEYRAILVPACEHSPLPTMRKLLSLAEGGSTIIFEDHLPLDVPGWNDLEGRRAELKKLLEQLNLRTFADVHQEAALGNGRIILGRPLITGLRSSGIERESLTDIPGLMFIRRAFERGWHYFIANRGEKIVSQYVTLAKPCLSVIILDPMTGQAGLAKTVVGNFRTKVWLQLEPGQAIILRAWASPLKDTPPPLTTWAATRDQAEIRGTWKMEFVQGGPELPAARQAQKLGSWTELGGEEVKRFAGTARYSIQFDRPGYGGTKWYLDLGKVCQSARVRLNGQELGTFFIPPFRVPVDELKQKDNLLEIEVTNVSANRIRDLDIRRVAWKNFQDINIVNLDYKPFDASKWPLTDSGLLGPVRLVGRAPLQVDP